MTWEPRVFTDDEPLAVIVSGDDFQGSDINIATQVTARMAVMPTDTDPDTGDWNSAVVLTDSTKATPVYRVVGPSPLDLSLVAGDDYCVFLELTNGGVAAVKRVAGILAIT